MKFKYIVMTLVVICGFYALDNTMSLFFDAGMWGWLDHDVVRYIFRLVRIAYYVFLALFFYKLYVMYKKEVT